MRTFIGFMFLSVLGHLTRFAWAPPMATLPDAASFIIFAIFAAGAAAFAISPALRAGGWVWAAVNSAFFGAAMGGGLFFAKHCAPTLFSVNLGLADIGYAAGVAGAYGVAAFLFVGLLTGFPARPAAPKPVLAYARSGQAPTQRSGGRADLAA